MYTIDETHDPDLVSWVESANGHADFPIQNLPLGVFSLPGEPSRGGIAIGDMILDLAGLAGSGLVAGEALEAARAASGETLNPLLALGHGPRRALRRAASALLAEGAEWRSRVEPLLVPMAEAELHLPARIGDFTDFFVGIHHAANIGRIIKPDAPLPANYRHVPIAYHGRASTVRPSGTPLVRPQGQMMPPGAAAPRFAPSARLDFELELGAWIARGNRLGQPIPIGEAAGHLAGLTLLNDWSARDIQFWEGQPLGPFLAKNFLSTVSPWLVTMEALAPFRQPQAPRGDDEPQPLDYLWDEADQAEGALSLDLEVLLSSAAMREQDIAPLAITRTPAANMYWTLAQMVAHHASNGCQLETGDLLGTGTISGTEEGSKGALMEATYAGTRPLALPTGEERRFLEDGDEVILTGTFSAPGRISIGFGPCRGTVLPALAG